MADDRPFIAVCFGGAMIVLMALVGASVIAPPLDLPVTSSSENPGRPIF